MDRPVQQITTPVVQEFLGWLRAHGGRRHKDRKTGQLAGDDPWVTMEWLMLQMASVGPMLGQANHFLHFNSGKSEYAEARYADEATRLYGVLDRRLGEAAYLAGSYSIADIATWPWIARWPWHRVDWEQLPNLRRW